MTYSNICYVFSVNHIHMSNSALQTVTIEPQPVNLAALYFVFSFSVPFTSKANLNELCVTSIVCFFGTCVLGSFF